MSIRKLVCDYLNNLRDAGRLTLPVDEEARAVLRAWMLAKKCGVGAPAPVAAQPAPPPAEPDSDVERSIIELRRAVEEPLEVEEEEVFFRPGGHTPQEAWLCAKRILPRWAPIQKLQSLRERLVWAEGCLSADVMFVGDAPGYYDEQEARPFCGDAGAKLDGVLKAMNLSRQSVYTTYLVKFRPMAQRQTTNSRPPSRDEVSAFLPVLEFEVKLVRPKVIVALGVIAARGILQKEDWPLDAFRRKQEASFCGVPVIVTHSPSYLLRTASLAERRSLWQDMLAAMELAHLPISDKQRGYFLPKQ